MRRRKGFHERPIGALDGAAPSVRASRQDFAAEVKGGDSDVVKRALKGRAPLATQNQTKKVPRK